MGEVQGGEAPYELGGVHLVYGLPAEKEAGRRVDMNGDMFRAKRIWEWPCASYSTSTTPVWDV